MAARRLFELILVLVIAAASVVLLLDDELPSLGLAVAAIALMIAWWRFKLPQP